MYIYVYIYIYICVYIYIYTIHTYSSAGKTRNLPELKFDKL